jgi:homospermidine synthase
MVVRHGEAFTISDFLTVRDSAGIPLYRPTVHYAYCPCPAAIASLKSLRRRKYRMQEQTRIMGDDILEGGRDELGVLLMGHDLRSWWTGTILTIDEARELVPGQNATTVQVAAAVLSAVLWMIRNPAKGVLTPDLLPHEEILDIASPYLGNVVSQAIDWAPKKVADATAWQFSSFHIPRATPRVLLQAHESDAVRTQEQKQEQLVPFGAPELVPSVVQ